MSNVLPVFNGAYSLKRQMMKHFILGLLLLITMCDDNEDCFTNTPKPDIVCIEIYEPVCGCNYTTYSNDCYASASGVSSWTKGACNSN